MQNTTRQPFEGVTTREASKGLVFDRDGNLDANGQRLFYERIKAGYLRDRHLLPVPAQNILDCELEDIEKYFRDYEDTEFALDRALCIPTMLMLAREMLDLPQTAAATARRRSLPLCSN